jgi:hypothetical protein
MAIWLHNQQVAEAGAKALPWDELFGLDFVTRHLPK